MIKNEGNRFRFQLEHSQSTTRAKQLDVLCLPYTPFGRIGVGTVHHIRAIVYNFDNNSKVKLESYVDLTNEGRGPYIKVHEKIDDGTWGLNSTEAKMDECGAKTKAAIISWSSPKIIFKTNKLNFDIYDIEVREIIPPVK